LKEILINAGFHTSVKSFHEDLVESSRRTLYLLWGGVSAPASRSCRARSSPRRCCWRCSAALRVSPSGGWP
jgi:hypothetical protein